MAATVNEQLEAVFGEVLGPIGPQELSALGEGNITKRDIDDYVERLRETGLLSSEEAESFREECYEALEEDD